ncbi:MAG: hypothetical protein LBK24_00990 [Puniceicoccales bacterium]|jgi:hypothetical protein|nr:hypothetical protein [Puniceicoccales bacterium]
MQVSTSDTPNIQSTGSPSTTGMKGRIQMGNAPKPLSMPKTIISSQGIEKFSTEASDFNTNVYSRMLSSKAVTLDKVPMHIFASQSFVMKCLEHSPKELIAHMNSWDQKQMSAFMGKYDVLPEAMLGRLFLEGLNPDLIPKDLKLSLAFLRVAANANPHKLVAEILNKEDIQSVRLALRNLNDAQVEKLWNNGMPTAKLPMAKSSNNKFVSQISAADPKRFENDIRYAVNATLRSKVGQCPLIKRSASST